MGIKRYAKRAGKQIGKLSAMQYAYDMAKAEQARADKLAAEAKAQKNLEQARADRLAAEQSALERADRDFELRQKSHVKNMETAELQQRAARLANQQAEMQIAEKQRAMEQAEIDKEAQKIYNHMVRDDKNISLINSNMDDNWLNSAIRRHDDNGNITDEEKLFNSVYQKEIAGLPELKQPVEKTVLAERVVTDAEGNPQVVEYKKVVQPSDVEMKNYYDLQKRYTDAKQKGYEAVRQARQKKRDAVLAKEHNRLKLSALSQARSNYEKRKQMKKSEGK